MSSSLKQGDKKKFSEVVKLLPKSLKDQVEKLVIEHAKLKAREESVQDRENRVAYRELKVSEREKRIYGRILNG
jgi:hypothetical protein